MRRIKWLLFLCPWFKPVINPNCELCECCYILKPKMAGYCVWGHKLKPFNDKYGNEFLTPEKDICGDYKRKSHENNTSFF